jgi:DNA-binding SARP family transcriptional activator
MATQFQLLGSLTVSHDGIDYTPTPPKVRQVLALLLTRAGGVLSTEALIEELWGDTPPPSAVTTTQTYIYQLRKRFHRYGLCGSKDTMISTRANGYVLHVDPEQVDVHVFEQLVRKGRTAAGLDRHREASTFLHQALELWTGRPLDNVAHGRQLQAHAVHLTEARTRAVELRIESDFALGLHRELIGELRSLVAEQPLNEWLHGKLITSLAASGRRSDALTAYQRLRTVLDEELGLQPSPDSQRLQYEVLNDISLAG